jgi:hypothetical protein
MSLPVSVLTAWRTVQQLPSLDDHPVLRQPHQSVYILTSVLRRLHDELRLLVEGVERGDPGDYSSLAADVLEELDLHYSDDEDVGSEYMLREEVREALLTRSEAYADLARAIARLEGGAAHVDIPPASARPRRRTPPPLREAMFHWDPMDMVLVPANYKSDDIHKLSCGLYYICVRIFEILAAYQRWEPIDPSAGPEILESLERCDQLMTCDDISTVGASGLRRMNRFLATARRVGEEYARLGREKDAGDEIILPQRVEHRTPSCVPLPDAVLPAWRVLQQLPPFDDHPVLRDPKSTAYMVTLRLRQVRDELGVLISGLEQSETLDYPTRAGDVLEQLHVHDTLFEQGVERDHRNTYPYDLSADVRAAVIATARALGDVARAIAKVEGSTPPRRSTLTRRADRRDIPPSVLAAMRGLTYTDARIVHADDYTANGTRELEQLLGSVTNVIMRTLVDITEWKPVKSSVGAELFRLLDDCKVILDDAEVARVVTKQRRKLDRFLSISRAIAQEFTRLSGDRLVDED